MPFSKGNLDNVVKYCKTKYNDKKVKLCPDNDLENTHKPTIKGLEVLIPDSKGDFNDHQHNPIELVKLRRACGEEIYDSTKEWSKQQMFEYINKLKDAYLYLRDKNYIEEVAFHDQQKIVPKNNLFLLTGTTGGGKTAFSLGQLAKYLKQGKKVVIWEHSETNRWNRLNKWIKDNKLEEYRDNGSLVYVTK